MAFDSDSDDLFEPTPRFRFPSSQGCSSRSPPRSEVISISSASDELESDVKIEQLYDVFDTFSQQVIDVILTLCRGKTERALQFLLKGLTTSSLLQLLRSRILKTSIYKIEMDPANLYIEGLAMYKDPNFEVSSPIEITFKG